MVFCATLVVLMYLEVHTHTVSSAAGLLSRRKEMHRPKNIYFATFQLPKREPCSHSSCHQTLDFIKLQQAHGQQVVTQMRQYVSYVHAIRVWTGLPFGCRNVSECVLGVGVALRACSVCVLPVAVKPWISSAIGCHTPLMRMYSFVQIWAQCT